MITAAEQSTYAIVSGTAGIVIAFMAAVSGWRKDRAAMEAGRRADETARALAASQQREADLATLKAGPELLASDNTRLRAEVGTLRAEVRACERRDRKKDHRIDRLVDALQRAGVPYDDTDPDDD